IVEKTIAVEDPHEILKVLEDRRSKEAQVARQHDSAVPLAWEEVTRENRSLRRLAQPTGLLDGESERLNELPGPNSGVVGQVVFQEGIVNEFFWAALNGLLKLNFNASA